MSHTLTIRFHGVEYYVIHNGGWDGDVSIRNNRDNAEVQMPGEVLTALAREAALELVRNTVISALERLEIPAKAPSTPPEDLSADRFKDPNDSSAWAPISAAKRWLTALSFSSEVPAHVKKSAHVLAEELTQAIRRTGGGG